MERDLQKKFVLKFEIENLEIGNHEQSNTVYEWRHQIGVKLQNSYTETP